MEPLVFERGNTVVSPVPNAAALQEGSTRDNEDDGMIYQGVGDDNGKHRSWKRWYLPVGIVFAIIVIGAIVTIGIMSNPYGHDCCVLDPLPEVECISEFGTNLGSDPMGVIGYSNCNEYTVSEIPNFISSSSGEEEQEIYTGMKWQCVEYSRRWLILTKQVTYDSIEYAYQIWDLPNVTNVTDNETKYPFLSYPSGQSLTPPEVGCLLIYNATDYLEPTGHVSVIVGVEDDKILIGEQNWANDYWLGKNYARNITISLSDGKYSVDDLYVIGWKCVDESR
jgi:hypothetical protein